MCVTCIINATWLGCQSQESQESSVPTKAEEVEISLTPRPTRPSKSESRASARGGGGRNTLHLVFHIIIFPRQTQRRDHNHKFTVHKLWKRRERPTKPGPSSNLRHQTTISKLRAIRFSHIKGPWRTSTTIPQHSICSTASMSTRTTALPPWIRSTSISTMTARRLFQWTPSSRAVLQLPVSPMTTASSPHPNANVLGRRPTATSVIRCKNHNFTGHAAPATSAQQS